MALRQLESGRRVHPRIRDDDEDSGSRAAQRDDAAGGEVGRPRDQVPTVQVDAEEDRLGEEREPFERERHPDDGAREPHELGPQEAQLERQHRPRHGAYRKEDRRPFRPALGQIQVDRVPRHLPTVLRHDHHHRHGDSRHGENDVERERHAHLRARREEVGHAETYLSLPSRSSIARLFENSRAIACSWAFAESAIPVTAKASARSSPTRNRRKRLSGAAGNHLSAASAALPSCWSTISDSTASSRALVSSGYRWASWPMSRAASAGLPAFRSSIA